MTSFLDLCGKACLIVSHDRIEEEGEGGTCMQVITSSECLSGRYQRGRTFERASVIEFDRLNLKEELEMIYQHINLFILL